MINPTIARSTEQLPEAHLASCFALLLTGLLFIANHAFAEQPNHQPIQPFVAKYTAENDYITGGKATLSLTQNDQGKFDFILQTTPTGIFRWSSKGNIREHAELPLLTNPFEATHYSYLDKGNQKRSYQIDFDRKNKAFSLHNNGSTATHPLTTGVLDRLSVTLAIMNEAQYNKNFSSITVHALDENKAQKIIFSNHGAEQVTTGLGKIDAIRIHKDRESSNRETIIWLAQLHTNATFVPVKIEHFKRGKLTLRLVITSFQPVE